MALMITKSRRPRTSDLDEHKVEISYKYCIEKWSIKRIKSYLKNTYSIALNEKQLQYRIRNWGLRKNVKTKEWEEIARQLDARASLGRPSEAIVNTAALSEKQLKRGVSRHATFTQLTFGKRVSNADIEVFTPPTLPSSPIATRAFCNLAVALERIPISITRVTLTKFLSKFIIDKNVERLDLSNVKTSAVFIILSTLIYGLSNNQVLYNVDRLLDQVDEFNCYPALIRLFSQDSISIRLARANLLPLIYLRGNSMLLRLARHAPEGQGDLLYDILDDCLRVHDRDVGCSWTQYPRRDHCEDIFREFYGLSINTNYLLGSISIQNAIPANKLQALDLLCACKFVAKDLSLFFRLWDPTVVPPRELNIIDAWGWTFYHIPLYTIEERQLCVLLEANINFFAELFLLEAVIHRNIRTACIIQSDIERRYPQIQGLMNPENGAISPGVFQDLIDLLASKVEYFTCRHGFMFSRYPENSSCAQSSQNERNMEELVNKCTILLYFAIVRPSKEIEDSCFGILRSCPTDKQYILVRAIDLLIVHAVYPVVIAFEFLGQVPSHRIAELLRLLHVLGVWNDAAETYEILLRLTLSHETMASQEAERTELLDTLLDLGADINGVVHANLPISNCPTCSWFLSGIKIPFNGQPLHISLYSKDSFTFRYLLPRLAKILGNSNLNEMLLGLKQLLADSFFAAVESNDMRLIEGRWEIRFKQNYIDQIKIASRIPDWPKVKNIYFLMSQKDWQNAQFYDGMMLVLSNIWYDLKNPEFHEERMEIWSLTTKEIEAVILDPETDDILCPSFIKKVRATFTGRVCNLIGFDKKQEGRELELFNTLFSMQDSFYSQVFGKIDNWWDLLIMQATIGSFQSLKLVLQKLQLSVDSYPCGVWDDCLFIAIEFSRLNTLVFLVERGISWNIPRLLYRCRLIYGWHTTRRCDVMGWVDSLEESRIFLPIEYAAYLGRIDIVAFFLELDPSYREAALAAVPEDRQYTNLLREYIKDWVPGASTTTIDVEDSSVVESSRVYSIT